MVEVNGKDLWVEFVKPMRNSEFCNHCTRIRVTSTGELKPCLMRDDNHIDIKEALEKGGDTDALRRLFIRAALSREPYWKPTRTPGWFRHRNPSEPDQHTECVELAPPRCPGEHQGSQVHEGEDCNRHRSGQSRARKVLKYYVKEDRCRCQGYSCIKRPPPAELH